MHSTEHPSRHLLRRCGPLIAMAAIVAVLPACSRNDDRSAGQKLDSAVSSVERKGQELKADAKDASRDAGQSVSQAGDAVATKSRDIAITTSVNAELARDAKLSALKINVDSDGGHVVLRGTAPDADSRQRATELAKGVDGVVAVDNELTVQEHATQ